MVRIIKKTVNRLSEFSIPLILGVFVALIVANLFPHAYHEIVHHEFIKGSYWSTLHFFVNDIFMVLFLVLLPKKLSNHF